MNCKQPECPNDAEPGSNYCRIHTNAVIDKNKTKQEIKFRALDKTTGKWIYFTDIDWDENCGGLTLSLDGRFETGELISAMSHPPDMKTLGQFIHMTDNTGKDLYQGDAIRYKIEGIVQNDPIIIKNVWDLHLALNSADSYYRIDESSLELIGNIFENPELLEE